MVIRKKKEEKKKGKIIKIKEKRGNKRKNMNIYLLPIT